MMGDRGKLGLLWVGATVSATGSGADGLGAGFVKPMGEDCLRMCGGPAVGQHLIQPRIVRTHRAKEMLLGTTLSSKAIAAALHFETQFHSYTVFKKRTGMSPSRWRSGCD
jgi:hypothetical protein